MGSSEKYVHGRDKLIAKYPAIFYSNRFKRVVYPFRTPWSMVSGISQDQFYKAKDDQQLLLTYFPYKEMSAKNKYSGFDYLKGNVYLSYNDFAGFFLRCSNNSGVQAHSDYIHGDFIASVDFGLLWSQLDIDIVNSSKGLYSYSDIYNDQRSLWIAPRDSACDRANFIFNDNCLSDVNGFSLPTVYTFNLNDVPDIHDDLFNNGIYTESEAQGYKGEMFNFKYPRSFNNLQLMYDSDLINMTLDDYTFTNNYIASIEFTDNVNDPVHPKTSTVFIKTEGDVYSKRAKMTAFNIHTGTGRMFTISVPEEYYINAIFFLGGLGLGHGLLVNGEVVPNNLTPNGIVNDTSLPICPIEDTESIWKANSKNLTSVSFADIATSNGSHTISAIYVSYAKKGETLVPPYVSDRIDTGIGFQKIVDLGLSVKWSSLNIGAITKTDTGNYYAWGSVQTHNIDNQDNYEWYDATTGIYRIPATNIAGTKYDVATHLLGGKWRMPTDDEFNELIDKCTWVATDNGFRVIGPNGNEIFLPFTGKSMENGVYGRDQMYYWSCKYNELPLHKEDHWAYYLTNYTSEGEKKPVVISSYVYNGMCIRPVEDYNFTPSTPVAPSEKPSNPDQPSGSGGINKPHPTIPDAPKDDIDTPVSSTTLMFTDTNESGYSVDPNVILYAGGQEVIPQTMTQKDNTLFLGNYKENNRIFSQEDLNFIRGGSKVYFTTDISPIINKGEIGSLYMYDNQLKKNSYDIASFKGGEVYRFGLVFQNKRGEWSDVVYIGDKKNNLYPKDYGTYFQAPKAQITISPSVVTRLYDMGYRKAKAVVVYPSINSRLTVCQGVLCPTVYNINSRKNNAPYAMSSWFYREMNIGTKVNIVSGTQNKHNYNIYNDLNDFVPKSDRIWGKNSSADYSSSILNNGSMQSTAEISCADITNYYAYNTNDSQNMYVDWNTITMNTPEVDFSIEGSPSTIPTENLKLRIIGVIPITSNADDVYVNTSTQPLKVASFTGLHSTNNSHNNIDYSAGRPRLTRFEWYDYDYYQDTNKERTDWDINKQHFETSDDYDLTRMQSFQQAFKQNIEGLKIYADHKVYPIFPWQGAKSLVGQYSVKEDNGMIYSALRKKVISNIRTSAFTYYFPEESLSYDIGNVGLYSGDIPLTKLSSDKNDVDHAGQFNYYGEVDTILSPKTYYPIFHGHIINYDNESYNQGILKDVSKIVAVGKTNDPVRIKYKSSPHLACHLNYTKDGKQEILPKITISGVFFGNQEDCDEVDDKTGGKFYIPGWSDRVANVTNNYSTKTTTSQIHQNNINIPSPSLSLLSNGNSIMNAGFLYIGEFYKDDPKDLSSIFGGTTSMAFEKNQWYTAGPTILLEKGKGETMNCLQGDTYYQRYDSLKTYPYTDEDPNQLVEILSFMCETRMNIDGRYDNKRGLSSNLYMNKVNFNLFNPAYTQQDNFFNYYFLDPERNSTDVYPNDFIWTKAKTMGEEIDTWSNISSSASYSLDGDKGSLNSIINYNDSLLTFQDTGIAKIMYNDRVQVAASDGIPIELANSQKVSGKQYLSNTIGCSNKKTIQITPNGVYFIDSNSKDLYTLGNGINSLTKAKGFNNYLYDKNISKFKTFYDKKLKDVYFINDENCLDFNEQLNEFEGFYDYEGTDYMFSYNDSFINIKNGSIWKQYAGDYNTFYGEYKPFWLTLISNDGNVDKTFNTVEFEADSWDKDNNLMSDTFDHLSTWDEYQIGESNLRTINSIKYYHFSNLKRKFRVWRANIPRELKLKGMSFVNALAKIQEGNIDNTTGRVLNMVEGLNRIRNTWAYIRLKKNNENKNKTVLHSIKVNYLY